MSKSVLVGALLVFLLAVSSASIAQTPVAASQTPSASPEDSPPLHPITEAQLRQMFAITHMLDAIQANMRASAEAQKKITSVLPPAFWDEMLSEFAKVDWVALTLPTFRRYTSAEDAEQVLAFYETPAGRRMILAQPRMTQNIRDAATKAGGEIGLRLGAKYSGQIEANQKKLSGQPTVNLPTNNPDAPK